MTYLLAAWKFARAIPWQAWALAGLLLAAGLWLRRHDAGIRAEAEAACTAKIEALAAAADAENARLAEQWEAKEKAQQEKFDALRDQLSADGKWYEERIRKLKRTAEKTDREAEAHESAHTKPAVCDLDADALELRNRAIDEANAVPE